MAKITPKKGAKPSPNAAKQWWALSPDEAARAISDTVSSLREHQKHRLLQQIISTRLYGNQAVLDRFGLNPTQAGTLRAGSRERMTFNVVQSGVDTITAKIAKNKPKPVFVTNGGDYRQQRKAKKLNKLLDGILFENNAYQQGTMVFRDACVWGDGLTKVFAKDGRVCLERVPCSEIWVDELEGLYGQPRQLHHEKPVDRTVLIAMFPESREAIEDAPAANLDTATATISDAVAVRESWRLPSGKGTEDGYHIITIEGGHALTAMEPWDRQEFPFARFQWSPRLFGFWGQGLAEQIQPIQMELNRLLQVAQRAHRIGGGFIVAAENGSKIVPEHLMADVGALFRYSGTAPTFFTPPLVQPEIYAQIERLKQAAYEQAGISQLSANSQKPAGLNSGKALREYNDIESDRFQTVGKAYEDYYLQIARLALATVKEITADEGDYKVRYTEKRFLQSINWKAIDLDEDAYTMQCFSISSLPSDPAGRMQTVTEWIQAGWYTEREGRRLLDFPDLEHVESLKGAAEEYLTKILDELIDEGKYTAPEPYDDLALARELALELYQQGRTNQLEPEKLEMLRTFMGQIDELQQTAQPPAPAQQAPANAQPTPTSELLPNVNQPQSQAA